uniref:Uncharacterized protein n=1 Tax=Denticeps clupeoides TaxID=299321 RepID=A0AAY4E8C9_9TELE
MTDSPSDAGLQGSGSADNLQLNKELERVIEATENTAVQLTWMAYDMVVLRSDPERQTSLRRLMEEIRRCEEINKSWVYKNFYDRF